MQTERKTYRKICQHCGKEFIALTSVTAYCSHRCASLSLKNKKRDERLKSTSIETRELKRLALLDKNFLSLSDAARLMQISRTTLYRIITIYSIPLHKFTDRTVRISREDLDKAARGQITAFDTSTTQRSSLACRPLQTRHSPISPKPRFCKSFTIPYLKNSTANCIHSWQNAWG